VPQANWVLAGGLIALAVGLAAYGIRAWLARLRARPVEATDSFPV